MGAVITAQSMRRVLTTGSTLRPSLGISRNPTQRRFEGGPLMRTTRVPSTSLSTTASTRCTTYGLKCEPSGIVAVVEMVIRNSPR